jgi:Glycosyltransferase family 92
MVSDTYLALATAYRDDAPYLHEWIEFHRLVGAERFFLYDNGSTDRHREILEPYLRDGTVVIHDWPIPVMGDTGRPSGLIRAFDDCISQHRGDARWIGFIDVDEFLFSPAGGTVADLLRGFEQAPGVTVHRAEFGTSGHRTRPPGLVIENYLHRGRHLPDTRAYYKSIVDPSRVERCASVHHFFYRDGLAVDENGHPVSAGIRPEKTPVSFERLRINHYRTKSEEELRRKWAMWAETGKLQPAEPPAARVELGGHLVTDDAITAYVPALRAALAR